MGVQIKIKMLKLIKETHLLKMWVRCLFGFWSAIHFIFLNISIFMFYLYLPFHISIQHHIWRTIYLSIPYWCHHNLQRDVTIRWRHWWSIKDPCPCCHYPNIFWLVNKRYVYMLSIIQISHSWSIKDLCPWFQLYQVVMAGQ